MTWFLDFRAQSTGGGLADSVAIYDDNILSNIDALKAAVGGNDLLVATHGFNVTRADGRNALSIWQTMLTLPANVAYIAVLWPGDSSWLFGLDYPVEGNEAIGTGNMLADFLVTNFPGTTLSLVSHSLGARVMLQTIRGIGKKLTVQNLMLMAGAIDDTCLGDEYADAAKYVAKISVLSSYDDEVLALAFPLGNLAAGIITRGSPYMHSALGREGPLASLNVQVQTRWQIPNSWNYGHHDYLPSTPCPQAPLPLPQSVPPAEPPNRPTPAVFDEWQQAWSAAVLCSRFWPGA